MKKTGDALGIEDPNWFGKGTLTRVDPGAEAVEKYATGIEHKYQNQKLSKIRSTFKNVILGNKKKYTAPPPKVSLDPLDPARKNKTLFKCGKSFISTITTNTNTSCIWFSIHKNTRIDTTHYSNAKY